MIAAPRRRGERTDLMDTTVPSSAKDRRARFPWRTYLRALSALSLTTAAALYATLLVDRTELRATAREITAGCRTDADQVLSLLHWVHAHLGTTRNPARFVWPKLRATPVQVLGRGGDCADKSRLLAAMVRELGMNATLAMCFDRPCGKPVHTVVDVTLSDGSTMLVDPAYELFFPRSDGTAGSSGQSLYFGLTDLRRDPGLLIERLDRLRMERPWPALVHFFDERRTGYAGAATINWDKNLALRAIGGVIESVTGERLYSFPRPWFLEDPKAFVALVLVTVGGCLSMASLIRVNRLACGVSEEKADIPTVPWRTKARSA